MSGPVDLVTALREAFSPSPAGVVAVYLFGSAARGRAGPRSDVDVAVLSEQTPPARLEGLGLDVAAELERSLGRPVDVVVLNRAPADLVHRVLRDGVLVLETDRSRRVAFEVGARRRYFDLQPIRDRYRRSAPSR